MELRGTNWVLFYPTNSPNLKTILLLNREAKKTQQITWEKLKHFSKDFLPFSIFSFFWMRNQSVIKWLQLCKLTVNVENHGKDNYYILILNIVFIHYM